MPHTVTWLDRLRIERVVWSLDQRLYDLPSRTRVALRREVRANLLAAAAEVGVTEALHRLGDARALAREYLDAELGEGPRHSWMAALLFLFTTPLVLNFFLSEATNAYQQALTATGAPADGTFSWGGVAWLQSSVTFAIHQGQATHTGGAWTPLVYILLVVGSIACGRLWRALPRRGNGGPATTATGAAG
ncbi:hypothetical protein [Streptacidiphilus jiangxiensis]|uniref:Uncharacterized protein n=1 Tax=Streptacidiphilus jiangxiensis TaxID=235985 RepID=A0A1H7TQL1_STRJI|nr:hypothetical protein [Streptacidiphilus jiangxiensis]SEL86147.1 hypothetical protein SAMN05414137_11497 [Streptacidiphilus jiangxiensis]